MGALGIAACFFLVIGTTYLAFRLDQHLKEKTRGWFLVFVIICFSVPCFVVTFEQVYQRYMNRDSRVMAYHWAMANLPEGYRILLESHTPQLPVNRYSLWIAQKNMLVNFSYLSNMSPPPWLDRGPG